ncbi:WSC-domain-containing protein [Thozetella sp. PMI_491]|nr:WSC-domain-containing protein [Thozetella sp. PMI_491]
MVRSVTWLAGLLAAAGMVACTQFEERAVVCSSDNLFNKFVRTPSVATSICQTYLGVYDVSTSVVTSSFNSAPTTTAIPSMEYPLSVLTTSYPASRLSSACSCLTIPAITKTVTVTAFVKSTAASTLPSSTWSTLGCYTEPAYPARALPTVSASLNMTNDRCMSICAAGGYTYAGTQSYLECWCGSSPNNAAPIGQGQCSFQCEGNATQSCGGSRALQLFQFTSSPTSDGSGASPTACGTPYIDTPDGYSFKFRNAEDLKWWMTDTASSYGNPGITFEPLDTDGGYVMKSTNPTVGFALRRPLNVVAGATYAISYRYYATTANIYPNGYQRDVDGDSHLDPETRLVNQWVTVSGQITPYKNVMTPRLYILKDGPGTGSIMISDLKLVLVTPAPTADTTTPTLSPSPVILVDFTTGQNPPVLRNAATFNEQYGEGSDGDVSTPFSPGYGQSAYCRQVDFTPGTRNTVDYTGFISNFNVPDATKMYVGKIHFRATAAKGCVLALQGPWGDVSKVLPLCDYDWTEVVTPAFAGSSTSYFAIYLTCSNPEFQTAKTKLWLDSPAVYQVL